jgi:deoxyribodipyrimidine photo-lyase
MNIMWFRNDLRIDDNTALLAAMRDSQTPLIAIYLLSAEQRLSYGIGRQNQFVAHALSALQSSLTSLDIPLIIVNVKNFQLAPTIIAELSSLLETEHVFFNIEHGHDERQRDVEVSEQLQQHNIECHRFHDDGLVAPWMVMNKQNLPYKVFTPFSKASRLQLELMHNVPVSPSGPHEANRDLDYKSLRSVINTRLKPIHCILSLEDAIKELDTLFDAHNKIDSTCDQAPASEKTENNFEQNQFECLNQFIDDSLASYKQNRDRPDLDATSHLSMALALGTLSVRRCYASAKNQKDSEGKQTWINELLWRDFYRYIMWHFPHVSKNQAFLSVDKHIKWHNSTEHFNAFCQGKTGIPLVDAGIRQLLTTGWMHNRVRMVVASFLTKNLWMDWRLGAAFFAEHLNDYDFASNIGGWQWAASIGTDAAPYFRVFNPVEQGKRFDPNAEYIKKYVPELAQSTAKQIHQHTIAPINGYVEAIVDLKQTRQRSIDLFKSAKQIAKAFEELE